VPDSRLEIIEGMGHDLPEPLWPRLADLILGHASEPQATREPRLGESSGAQAME